MIPLKTKPVLAKLQLSLLYPQQAEEKEEILVKLVNKVVQVVAVDLMLMAEVKETYHQYLLLKAIRGDLQDQDRTQR